MPELCKCYKCTICNVLQNDLHTLLAVLLLIVRSLYSCRHSHHKSKSLGTPLCWQQWQQTHSRPSAIPFPIPPQYKAISALGSGWFKGHSKFRAVLFILHHDQGAYPPLLPVQPPISHQMTQRLKVHPLLCLQSPLSFWLHSSVLDPGERSLASGAGGLWGTKESESIYFVPLTWPLNGMEFGIGGRRVDNGVTTSGKEVQEVLVNFRLCMQEAGSVSKVIYGQRKIQGGGNIFLPVQGNAQP